MTERIYIATVSTARDPLGRFRVVVDYEDGDSFVSQESWENRDEADQYAQRWAIQNYQPDGKAS